jgi:hypothetical protein
MRIVSHADIFAGANHRRSVQREQQTVHQLATPESFTLGESILIMTIVVIGGMGNVFGVTIGALTMIVLETPAVSLEHRRQPTAYASPIQLHLRFRRERLEAGAVLVATTTEALLTLSCWARARAGGNRSPACSSPRRTVASIAKAICS